MIFVHCKNHRALFHDLKNVGYLDRPTYPKFSAVSVRTPPREDVDTALRNKRTAQQRKASRRRASSRHETNASDRILFALARPVDILRCRATLREAIRARSGESDDHRRQIQPIVTALRER